MPNLGGWGTGKWGSTLVWGWQLAGVAGIAQVIDTDIIAALEQTTSTALKPSATVTIDGTDVSSSVVRGTITLQGNGAVNAAEVTLLNSSTTVTVHVSEIVISISYVISSTVTYTVERFRGLVHEDVQTKSLGRTERALMCMGHERELAEQKPVGFYQSAYNWYYEYTDDVLTYLSLDALNCINAVTLTAGLGLTFGAFISYSPLGIQPNSFPSQLALIADLAAGSKESILFVHPAGYVVLNNYDNPLDAAINFPLTCQVSQEPAEESDRYNRVVTTGTQQSLYYPSGGGVEVREAAISNTYNDTTKQATQGILPYYITDSKISDANDILERATSIVANSNASVYRWRSVLNPFVWPGETCTLTLANSTTDEITIYKVTDSFGWTEGEGEGFWSSWEGRTAP